MDFTRIPWSRNARNDITPTHYPSAYLIDDDWDDFSYKTTFYLVFFSRTKNQHNIGAVKIGKFDMPEGYTGVEPNFQKLTQEFFSLGQGEEYYIALKEIDEDLRIEILSSLNDIAYNLELFEKAYNETVTQESLLRSLSVASVKGQYHRLSTGGARLTNYQFSYSSSLNKTRSDYININFNVIPESFPPSNIHILIGRNGVGKTRLIQNMKSSLLLQESDNYVGNFEFTSNDESFSNLVSVEFSAFDDSEFAKYNPSDCFDIPYSYIGLKKFSNNITIKDPNDLCEEFVQSVIKCVEDYKINLLKETLTCLESDPIFQEINISDLINSNDIKKVKEIFHKFSSGHKIVLLTLTRLVEVVEEKTLVLLDEPESHLHPPLLSAFSRSLSNLLIYRNGVAIIATHSPIILQEVPKSCVWKIRRNSINISMERPQIETFGENLGILTREIFGLEVTHSGFHQLLNKAVNENLSFEKTLELFSNQLGNEAKAILRGLIFVRDSNS